MNPAELTVGVDIGGTFTDCTMMHDGGRITTGKSPTTPDDRSQGFFDSIESAASQMGSTLASLLERVACSYTGRRRARTRSSSDAERRSDCSRRAATTT